MTTTQVARSARRVLLPQTLGERARGVWWGVTRILFFRFTPPALGRWRNFLLRRFGAKVHPSARIASSVRIDFPWNLRVGRGVVIAHKVILNCMGEIEIGDRTMISQYAHLCAGTHDYERRDMAILRCPITVGADVWIAADAFVGPGVTIGDGALLAARSSAFGDLPGGQVCVGEPARPRRPRQQRGRSSAADR